MRRRDRLYGLVRRHPLVLDAVLSLVLFPILALPMFVDYRHHWVQVVLGGVMCGALVFRRMFPVGSFVVVAACGLAQWAVGMPLTQLDILLLLSLFSVSAYGPRWASRAGFGVGLLGAVLASSRYLLPEGGESFLVGLVGLSTLVVAAWTMGDVRRVRRMYVEGLVDRAKQAERERDQQARIAVADERARIARDMHDVVAHNLAVIVVQADGGRYAAGQDPAAAVTALRTIGDTGRAALVEMRGLLGVLRADAGPGSPSPQPDVGQLPVTLDVGGPERPLPAGRSLAVFRVIQEALTNTLKHAGPAAQARVRLSYGVDRLWAEVIDDGRGVAAADDGMGHGVLGMSERVSVYGGSVAVGPGRSGGWRVELDMPYGDEE